jgi:phage terminase large subunit
MPYQATTATRKLLKLRKRIKGVAGGTSAGKTISILQILTDKAQSDKTPTLTSVVSESFPHLRRGAMRDFLNIMQEHGYYQDDRWSKTEYIYTFETGSRIEFFSADQPSKVRGPRRDRLYINECNNIPYEAFDQLEVRTKHEIWLDWNPTNEFWFYEQVAPNREHDFITLTYLDNEGLDRQIVDSIESRRANKAWWTVYGLGQLGEVEGKIFTDWQIIDEIPHEARLERRGLDFGYSNDPSALVDIYSYNGGIILDEQLYQKGMSNKQIADLISNLPQPRTLVVADSSEPKSIDELSSYGVNVIGANKGQGSVLQGIQKLQDQRVSITKRSTNGIKEYRNYMWMTDRDGKIINVPMDMWNHFMDATRYGNESLKPSRGEVRVKQAAWVGRVKQQRR